MGGGNPTLRPPEYAAWVQARLMRCNREHVVEVFEAKGWDSRVLGVQVSEGGRASAHDNVLTIELDSWIGMLPKAGKRTFNCAVFHGEGGSYTKFAYTRSRTEELPKYYSLKPDEVLEVELLPTVDPFANVPMLYKECGICS